MVYKIVTTQNPGDTARYGPDDITKIAKLLSGFDLSLTDPVEINTDFKFRSSKLAVSDPSNLRKYKIQGTDGATGDVTLTIPLPSGGATTDSFVLASAGLGTGDMLLGTAQTITANKIFNDGTFLLRNPANTFSATVKAGAQTANQTFTFPVAASDTIALVATAQTLTNKSMSGGSNTFTAIPKSAIPASTLYNDVDNDLGAHFINIFQLAAPSSPATSNIRVYHDSSTGHLTVKHSDGSSKDLEAAGGGDMVLASVQTVTGAKTFNDTKLLLRNPADTFSATLGAGAQTAARTFTFPVTTSDTISTIAATQTQTNKTMSVDLNTFNHSTTNAAGDIWKSDGTKMTRLARGTAGQVLQVNGGGTDVAWQTLSAGSGDMLLGTAQTVTAAKTFNDTTLLLRNPANTFSVTMAAGAQTAARTFTFPVTASDNIVLEAATQTMTNKTLTTPVISSISNSGTVTLPTGADTLVGRATTDTFTAVKTFGDGNLGLRNPADTFTATIKSGAQTAARTFTFPTSGNTSDTIAVLAANVTWSGTQNYLDNNLRLNNPALTASYNVRTGAITADRQIKLPILTGTDTFIFDVFDRPTRSPLVKRQGRALPKANTLALDGSLSDHTFGTTGTIANSFDTTEGVVTGIPSTAASGVAVGLVSATTGVGIGRRLFASYATIRCKIDSTTTARFYFGFTSATALPISDTPLASTDHGVLIGWRTTDTNFQSFNNDGSAAMVATDLGVAKDANYHTFEISWTASGNATVTLDGTASTISTRLPGTTTNLFFFCEAQTSASTARTLTIRGAYVEFDK